MIDVVDALMSNSIILQAEIYGIGPSEPLWLDHTHIIFIWIYKVIIDMFSCHEDQPSISK